MSKTPRASYQCSECGWTSAKWVGRCGECQAWGSVAEALMIRTATRGPRAEAAPVTSAALPIAQVSVEASAFRSSGVPELDRVLGGGLVPGAAILLAGEPGVGKSTLLLEVAAQTSRYQRRTLYVTGEESASQVRLRADRTGGVHDELYVAAETDLGAILTHVEQVRPEVLVVDSIQTIGASGLDGVPGGVTQVKEVAAALIRVAKTRNITTIIVGHVTKDGSIAGPRVLEHVVDVVLHFEGDRNSRFRMVRALKNRFGPVDEVGCFDLAADGITAVTDPSGLFVENHQSRVPGTCVAVAMDGRRLMLAEIQALVAKTPLDRPRRTTSGLDSARVAMILAALQQHCHIALHTHDVFVSTVGGARLAEPASDLAIAIALASAAIESAPPHGVVALGEISLAGEVRKVRDLPQRIAEAARLGFRVAVVPVGDRSATPRRRTVDGMTVVEVGDLRGALSALGLAGHGSPARPGAD
ncbi:DNA repair protein RadA [Nocardioides sp.]|jgi:DNA repair protein RadA/Sms|uniref:DNA repair protein RadA n=1 Tax=Nocardioides sp. TaxID=35761 RepID=UPI002F42DC5F